MSRYIKTLKIVFPQWQNRLIFTEYLQLIFNFSHSFLLLKFFTKNFVNLCECVAKFRFVQHEQMLDYMYGIISHFWNNCSCNNLKKKFAKLFITKIFHKTLCGSKSHFVFFRLSWISLYKLFFPFMNNKNISFFFTCHRNKSHNFYTYIKSGALMLIVIFIALEHWILQFHEKIIFSENAIFFSSNQLVFF